MCPQCQTALVRVTVRTSEVVMYRCNACDETWNVPKPIEPIEPPAAVTPPDPDGSAPVISAAPPHGADSQTAIQRARVLIESVSQEAQARNGKSD